jgi:hypothetical protein
VLTRYTGFQPIADLRNWMHVPGIVSGLQCSNDPILDDLGFPYFRKPPYEKITSGSAVTNSKSVIDRRDASRKQQMAYAMQPSITLRISQPMGSSGCQCFSRTRMVYLSPTNLRTCHVSLYALCYVPFVGGHISNPRGLSPKIGAGLLRCCRRIRCGRNS